MIWNTRNHIMLKYNVRLRRRNVDDKSVSAIDTTPVVELCVFDDNHIARGIGACVTQEIDSANGLMVHLKVAHPAAVDIHTNVRRL